MAGIVGINRPNSSNLIHEALEKIAHRGKSGSMFYELDNATCGQVWAEDHQTHSGSFTSQGVVLDGAVTNWGRLCQDSVTAHHAIERLYFGSGPGFVGDLDGSFALAMGTDQGLFIARDTLGIAPLYTGSHKGDLCFASEVKALLGWAENIQEFPPGNYYHPDSGLTCYREIAKREPINISGEDAAVQLRRMLMKAVAARLAISQGAGAWLSGGLDSSAIAALACRQSHGMKTFSVGLEGSPDIEFARIAADHINSQHYELIVTIDDIFRTLPAVIYHLESFDALLVRSSVMNYLVGRLASKHVPYVFSGEGGDELFAGYEYLKKLKPDHLADELIDITNRLHNTALQRVDRCSSAHGLIAHVAFLDKDVLDLALSIPTKYKLHRNGKLVEKWVLRRAMDGLLPDVILERKKSKFWEGSGITDILEHHASETISDNEFAKEQTLPDGGLLRSKEELLYYRIFKEHFGELEDLSFVGRTKNTAPVHQKK